MKKRILFVVNPSSGTVKIKDSLLDVCQIFCEAGYDLTLNVTKYISDAIKEALNGDIHYDLVAVSYTHLLSDGNNVQSGVFQHIQSCRSKRLQGIIMAVAGTFKSPPLFAHIRSGNDPTDLPFFPHGQLSGNLTAAIQLL